MGCIEIRIHCNLRQVLPEINRNMGCIEIFKSSSSCAIASSINRNMGCIEIVEDIKYPAGGQG